MNTQSKQQTPTIGKEGLHTPTPWYISPRRHLAANEYSFFGAKDTYIGLFSFSVGHHSDMDKWKAVGKANAELICKAVNEREQLLKSNKELLAALEEITDMALRWSVKGVTPTIHHAQRAINNAKSINS